MDFGMWIGLNSGQGMPLIYGAFVLLIAITAWVWVRTRSIPYTICFGVFGLYLLAAIDLVFFPIRIITDYPRWTGYWWYSINLVPFRFDLSFIPEIVIRQIVQNILLTVPFGFGLSFVLRERVRRIWLIALLVGLSTELIQLGIGLMLGYLYRTIDVNDVMLNALGVLIGYGLFRVFAWVFLLITYWLHPIHRGVMAFLYEITRRTEPPLTM